MVSLSSNWTLIFKLFVPVLWVSFFGAFCIAAFIVDESIYPGLSLMQFRILLLLFFLLGSLLLYFSLFSLKKVDGDERHIYISNYFKTYKYPYTEIKALHESDLVLFKLMRLDFQSKSSFGKRIRFIANMKQLEAYLQTYPDIYHAWFPST